MIDSNFNNYKNFCKFFGYKETSAESLKKYYDFKKLVKVV